MKAKFLHGFWLLTLVVSFGESLIAQTPPPQANAKTDSVLLTIENKVDVSRAGATDWLPARTNQTLLIADRVRTSAKSRAAIRLSNLSVLRVNELTTLAIQAPPQASAKPTLELKSGSTYFFSRERPTELQFKTPLVSGAIRGTEFNLTVAEDGRTLVTLLDGAIDLSNEFGATNLVSGEQGVVEAGKAPSKTAVIDAINIIQWSLYYPGIVDVDELSLGSDAKQTLSNSLTAYRSGDLLGALSSYPENRSPVSDAERIYRAALLLAVGQVEQTEAALKALPASLPMAEALRELIAAVKHQTWARSSPAQLATEWMAESYYQQSRAELEEALKAARAAASKSPNFGFAWVRVAELEFSFGRVPDALAALEKGLRLSPRNAEGLSLKGFLLASQNKIRDAVTYFDQAIAIDGALGNAWLGRGLCRIRQGDGDAGRQDLQVAATLEPNRAVLRSYLGKAFSYTKDEGRAEKELNLARKLDENDPTSWLYSALLNQQRNRINEAVSDLEKSQDLNKNRSVFRSKLLLDQDRAVRSANLAGIYRDAGMFDVSVREASRAVNYDYGNYSAHLFLANSYDAIRDPKLINLRYETPWFSERLMANLLAPVGAGSLSQNVSQQEYSKLFERDRLGVSSSTEYFSSGQWIQQGSQYGTFGNSSYSIDAYYSTDPGQRPNNDIERLNLYARFKQQITPQDSVYFEAQYVNDESGDVAQYYNQASGSTTFRAKEKQQPNVFAGFHHEWGPGSHTLFLAGRLTDDLQLNDPGAKPLFVRYTNGVPARVSLHQVAWDQASDLEAYSAELQQIWQASKHTIILGGRYQTGANHTKETVSDPFLVLAGGNVVSAKDIDTDLDRISLYAYDQWQILDGLQLTAGISYDRLHYPRNVDTTPIITEEATREQVSPKVGFIWTPMERTHVRGAFTRSLGGVFFDNSVRLEPTQVASFNQAYRSLIPESVVGLVPGTRFETISLGVDHAFKTRTYFGLSGELLSSDASRTVGVLTNATFLAIADRPSSTGQSLSFEEKTLFLTLNQLVANEWSFGVSYRLSRASLQGRYFDIPSNTARIAGFDQNEKATLHQLYLDGIYNHRCGFFAQFQAVWNSQSNEGYRPDIPGDDFWQANVFAGYRFLRRAAEVKVGVLNLNDRDYKLNPLTLYSELPRERTFYASLKFYF